MRSSRERLRESSRSAAFTDSIAPSLESGFVDVAYFDVTLLGGRYLGEEVVSRKAKAQKQLAARANRVNDSNATTADASRSLFIFVRLPIIMSPPLASIKPHSGSFGKSSGAKKMSQAADHPHPHGCLGHVRDRSGILF